MTSRNRIGAVLGAAGLAAAIVLVIHSGVLFIRGEEVLIRSGDVTLTATLALPRWERGPMPAAVIVHGSGPVHRRELRGYARRLVPRGMAVLMYDKRGVGDSGGTYGVVDVEESEAMLGLLADDAVSAVRFLMAREDIDASRIGLVGGSQAGWIMPLAASRASGLAFIVSISGPAVAFGEEIYYSQLTGDDPGPYRDLSDAEIQRRLAEFDGARGYDPAPVLEKLTVPSLWILGGRDRSVPTHTTVANLNRIMAGTPATFDVKVYPNGDHSLRHAATGKRIDYWPYILDWLRERGIAGT